MLGAGVYAFLESVRSGLDDNIVAALPTALAAVQHGHGTGRRRCRSRRPPSGGARRRARRSTSRSALVMGGAAHRQPSPGAVAGAVVGFRDPRRRRLGRVRPAVDVLSRSGPSRRGSATGARPPPGLAQANAGPARRGQRRRRTASCRRRSCCSALPADRVRRGLRRGARGHARHGGRHALRPARVLAARRFQRAAPGNAGRRSPGRAPRASRSGRRSWPPRRVVWGSCRSRRARRVAALGGIPRRAVRERRERFRAAHRVRASTTSSPTR